VRFPSFRASAIALAVAALLSTSLPAEESSAESCPAIDNPSIGNRQSSIGNHQFRAFIDPATGKLRPPTAEELRRLAEERRRSRTETAPIFEIVVHPDGTKSVDLQDAFLFDLVVERLPDGSMRFQCVPRARGSEAAHPMAAEK
jgi:hypothetical protein